MLRFSFQLAADRRTPDGRVRGTAACEERTMKTAASEAR
jgi:hypothetical protein